MEICVFVSVEVAHLSPCCRSQTQVNSRLWFVAGVQWEASRRGGLPPAGSAHHLLSEAVAHAAASAGGGASEHAARRLRDSAGRPAAGADVPHPGEGPDAV